MFSSNASQVSSDANYIESCFSTYLYTGTSANQTITNNIDLSGKGGLVWSKARSSSATNHLLIDTARGASNIIESNTTTAQYSDPTLNAFNSTGYNLTGSNGDINYTGRTYASWTFRKQPKFFDIVTYTGNGANRTIAHNLGSVPGCIIIKRTDSADNWIVYHRSLGNDYELFLDLTYAKNYTNDFNFTDPTSTTFAVNGNPAVNASGGTYVAYLFAHNAGGFGLTGTDNVITCGSFTTDGSYNASVTLGYEPQWIMIKRVSGGTGNWDMFDNMRGMPAKGLTPTYTGLNNLFANLSSADGENNGPHPNSTGFDVVNYGSASTPYIYIAIRRGPMKVPTDGTTVFAPIAATTGTQTTSFPIDMMMQFWRTNNDIYANTEVVDRLRGVSSNSTAQSNYLLTTSTGATDSLGSINASKAWTNTGFDVPPAYAGGSNGFECFRRAPSFFDEVCYTGTGSATTQAHNLQAVPELMILKSRSNGYSWPVYCSYLSTPANNGLYLNSNGGFLGGNDLWNNTTPTSSVFSLGTQGASNFSGATFVAYLFATCPGVSKVGTYTGNGTSQAIACGFTGGARFVLIKRTDDVGGWYVYDTARGMTTLTDPYLFLNSTAAEVATLGSVTTTTGGFTVNASILSAINTSGGSYIFFAVA